MTLLATGCFRVSSSTQALRETALENLDGVWEERIEISVGRLTFAAAQLGGRFVELPPEAKTILDCAKGAEVSVWEGRQGQNLQGATILKKADRRMKEEGWCRVVGVINEDELVAIYVPEDMKSTRDVQVSVLVLQDRQMVCVAARSDIEPLFKLGLSKIQEHGPLASAR